MALEYDLKLQDPAEPVEAADRLVAGGDFVRSADGIEAPDLLVGLDAPSASTQEIIRTSWLQASVQVWFRLKKRGDTNAAELRIVRASATLLAAGAGDAVLLFNGEDVVLLRKQGKLLLNRDLGFWSDERRALLALPHELESIPHI